MEQNNKEQQTEKMDWFIEKYNNNEIARIIGVNENTIRKRLEKAREKLLELGITA